MFHLEKALFLSHKDGKLSSIYLRKSIIFISQGWQNIKHISEIHWEKNWETESKYELPNDRTNKMTVRPANTQISLGICSVWSESSLSAWRKLGSLATHWAHSEDWSDWADAQADLSLCWVHVPFCWFCHKVAHICVKQYMCEIERERDVY